MGWMTLGKALRTLPGLIARGRFDFAFDAIPFHFGRLSGARRMNLLRAGLDLLARPDRVLALPSIVQVEPTNACNLRCPLCPSGTGLMRRRRGRMEVGAFESLLDEMGPALMLVLLYGWGEPFLNPDLPRMIAACTARGVRTLTSTNGHGIATLDQALEVVDAGLSALIIAIDGSTQEIYDAYRKGGDVERVMRGVSLIEAAKARRNSPLPITNLRTVVTRHNEADVGPLEELARELGVNMFSVKTLGCLTRSAAFPAFEPESPDLRRFEMGSPGGRRRRPGRFACPYPFRQPTIFWDGTAVACEFDIDAAAPMGHFGTRSFRALWNGPEARRLRRCIRDGRRPPLFCATCPYRDRRQDGTIIRRVVLRPWER